MNQETLVQLSSECNPAIQNSPKIEDKLGDKIWLDKVEPTRTNSQEEDVINDTWEKYVRLTSCNSLMIAFIICLTHCIEQERSQDDPKDGR